MTQENSKALNAEHVMPARAPRRLIAPLRRLSLLVLNLLFGSAVLAQSGPSQSPLLIGTSGAKPNLMVALDNSGSMGFTWHETYGVLNDVDTEQPVRNCPAGATGSSTEYRSYGRALNGRPNGFPNTTNICLNRVWNGFQWVWQWEPGVDFPTPRRVIGSFAAQRSPQVNPVYYNPRITYTARVNADGSAIAPNNWRHISNTPSTSSTHSSFEATSATNWWHSILDQTLNPRPTNAPPYSIYYSFRVPAHQVFTDTTRVGAPAFTYANCTNVLTNPQNGRQDGCGAWTYTHVQANDPAQIVTLPTDHKRTDCNVSGNPNSCTNAQERANIVNWYRWYITRMEAVKTSVGQALANDNYQREIRVGYMPINHNGTTITWTPGTDTTQPAVLRGVRMLDKSLTAAGNTQQQIYDWLYGMVPWGGTPLHNAVQRVGDYYRVRSAARENPWAVNPAVLDHPTTNPEKSCRRSFNILLSDGGWNAETSTIPGQDFDNTRPPISPPLTRTLPDGTVETFRYDPAGMPGDGRRRYTPYPSTATGGLADLTAQFFWHSDLRENLANDIQTRNGQPAFWQNMTTYTVGYMIRPSGDYPGAPQTTCANYTTSLLTFRAIECYQAAYAASNQVAPAPPRWPSGNLNATSATDQQRIDDFIQAGYTGGGRSFSVSTSDEVRSAFNIILSDILNSTGRDAGVAVSSTSADTASLAGNLKYNVTYRTIDNSGNVVAQELDAQGNVASTRWQASTTIPAHSARRVFSISGQNSPFTFIGNFSGLPADVRSALQAGSNPARIPSDNRFVNYLRGLDPVVDNDGALFRQRSEKMGSMVNPPSIYMGGDRDYAYDLVTGGGAVSGSTAYEQYVRTKVDLPAALFVATNAGQVHAFDAANGTELAAFMPRRSMRRLLDNAREDYSFRYVLDGPLSDHDIFSSANSRWNHLAIGTGGRGERLVYAIRSPLNTGAATPNRQPGEVDFLWETGPDSVNAPDFGMGHITHPARSGQTESGDWVVLLNSGHHNGFADGSRHGLVVLNALNGNVIRRIPLPGGFSAGRGLSGVTVVRDPSKRIVAAYAGDANGNLWRFNLRGSPAAWGVSYGRPLFTTPGNRPIYGAPAWQVNGRQGGTMVIFATGMLLDDSDPADVSSGESIYGIWDPTPVGQSDVLPFVTRSSTELLTQSVMGTGDVGVDGNRFFRTTENRYDTAIHKGWRMALVRQTGERNIDQVRNLGPNVLIATTVVAPPPDPNAEICRLSDLPTNYLYVLDAQSGSMARRALDRDGDGRLETYGMVQIERGGYSRGMAVKPLFRSSDRWTATVRKRNSSRGDEGESAPDGKCSPINARLLGTEGGSIGAGGSCESGWNRSQYQLSRPPQ